jgi:hypothetical protein
VSEFIKKHQFLIACKNAKTIGKTGLYKHLDKDMVEFFNEICKAVLNGDDDVFAIQWAISRLDEEEKMVVENNLDVKKQL